MNNWQLDIIREQADSEAWRRLNEADPCTKQMENASVSLTEAVQFINIAENRLADAMAEVFDTPMEYRIGSFLDQLQELKIDLKSLAEKYRKGERE